jgi:predicted nucleic acid-binding protein
MTRTNNLDELRRYLHDNKPKVLLDTNVIITACSANSAETELVADLCAEMDVKLCDTVYWEFLRNTNLDKFRTRRSKLATWHGGDLAAEQQILHEGRQVRDTYDRLLTVLLYLLRNDPARALAFATPDLWIAATCVENRLDHILTLNVKDFPRELFSVVFQLNNHEHPFCLLRFERDIARDTWRALTKRPVFPVNYGSFLRRTKHS